MPESPVGEVKAPKEGRGDGMGEEGEGGQMKQGRQSCAAAVVWLLLSVQRHVQYSLIASRLLLR